MSLKVTGSTRRLSVRLPGEGQTLIRQGDELIGGDAGGETLSRINANSSTLLAGSPVATASDTEFTKVRAVSGGNVLGILLADTIVGAAGQIAPAGEVDVRMEAGEDILPGQSVWLSSNYSICTTIPPATRQHEIGVITDQTNYLALGTCKVRLGLRQMQQHANMLFLPFDGVAAAGPVALAGATVGSSVAGVIKTSDFSAAGGDFEGTISVANEIQQVAESDLSLETYLVVLKLAPIGGSV